MNPYVNYDRRAFLRLAVVVAQLVEQSLLIPEVHGSNPVIHKIYIEHLFTVNCIENRETEACNGPLLKKIGYSLGSICYLNFAALSVTERR